MSPGGRVLVTGATGFIGSAIVRALLERGYAVRALARASSPRDNLEGVDVELAIADLRDADAVARAMRGARHVIHAAADYRLWAPRPEEILGVNVTGTLNLIRAALSAGVERIVYTSSVATLALRPGGAPADETVPLSEPAAIGAYKRSKVLAEREVQAMITMHGAPVVIVHPSTPIGPRDIRPTPTGRVVVEAARGRIPAFVDTGLNLVHVDDVAQGHVAALERGRIGERYILGGHNVALSDMLREIARQTGRRPPRMRLPRRLLYPAAMITEGVARFTRREPLLTLDGLRMARHRMYFTSAKAQRELRYEARPYEEALADAIAWFGSKGYLQ